MHLEIDDAVGEGFENDVAAVRRHRWPHARLEQLFDLGDDFVVLFRGGRLGGAGQQWLTGGEMLDEGAEHGRFQLRPGSLVGLADGDEIGAEKHLRHAVEAEEPQRQRRARRRVGIGEIGRSLLHHASELLLAALGACTNMTLRMYAERKRWPLEGVQVRLTHLRTYAKDCATCDTKEGMLDRIDREILLIGNLSDEQRDRLMEIADRCPIHRTLVSEVQISTKLATTSLENRLS